MPIIAKGSNNTDYEKTPLGTQQAICVFVEDIGTQEGSYMGESIRNRQVVICWELAETMVEGENAGKPFMITKFYTLSLNEKANLRKDLESWRGKPFTLDELAGFDLEKLKMANCLLNIVEAKTQAGKTYPKIAAISPLLKNMDKLVSINSNPPEWIQKKREESVEWQEKNKTIDNNEPFNEPIIEDGLPF